MADLAVSDTPSILSDLSIAGKTSADVAENEELGQDEFLELMTAQLQNQDPLSPMENGEFIAQLAQFGTVEGIGDLQASFDNLTAVMTASDASDAATLVGKNVLIEGDVALLDEANGLSGAVEVPDGVTEMQVTIESIGGVTLDSFNLPGQPEGTASFNWDGVLEDGTTVPSGHYVISAVGASASGAQSLKTFVGSKVDSVSMAGEGGDIVLNLSGMGSMPLSEVTRIGL